VDKANRIFKNHHKNIIKEMYKVYRFSILKTPAIHRKSAIDQSMAFTKMTTIIHLSALMVMVKSQLSSMDNVFSVKWVLLRGSLL
jgi:hypothetical protein